MALLSGVFDSIGGARTRARALGAIAVLALTGAVGAADVLNAPAAMAQGFQWPWEEQPRPRPRPRYQEQPQPQYQPPPQYQPAPQSQYGNNDYGRTADTQQPICLQLEQRLVQESQRGSDARTELPRIEAEIRELNRTISSSESELDRRDCYEYFLFSKTLRRTRQCLSLVGKLEDARRSLAGLETQRQAISASGSSSYQDEIIRELARNNCGQQYSQEARRRDRSPFSGFWQDEDSAGGNQGSTYGRLPFATYRTMCVRLCDGYYFPVSFSTLPNHFQRDAEVCQTQCAAPAKLYYYQNPGSVVDEMVSFDASEPYSKLPTAFTYRKQFIQGCSCKQAEFVAPDASGAPQQQGEALSSSPARRADAASNRLSPTR